LHRGSTSAGAEAESSAASGAGLLIVNADDWGGNALATDATADCFAGNRVTSATGMVYMADSERAAEIARARDLPIGLHLNLTLPFDGSDVPPRVRERQATLVKHFRHLSLRRWTYSPWVGGDVREAIADQLERFRVLYGREPTHLDSHHHAHVCLDVLQRLPRGTKVRTTHSRTESALAPAAVARSIKRAAIRRRFVAPDYLFSIRSLYPEFGGSGLERVLALADSSSVEIMVHPQWSDEQRLLMSDAWLSELAGHRLGSFESLR
jgi:chitin disaccharide deacetylase